MKFPAVAFSLFAATSLLAESQDCPKNPEPAKPAEKMCCPPLSNQECLGRGEPLECCVPGYNAPAAIDVCRKMWKCYFRDFTTYFDVSFIYWFAGEEGLTVAETGVLNGGTVYFPQIISTQFQDFNYRPGFKIGLGTTVDHEWTIGAEYTWYRARHHTDSSIFSGTIPTAGTAAALSGAQVWVVDDWFLQGAIGQSLSGTQVSSCWRLSMDLIDLFASRPFYQARRLILSPFAGLEGAFIRQSMSVKLSEASTLFEADTPIQPIQSRNRSSSWAIGPKMGLGAEYLLPLEMRIEANLAAALLYTTYHVAHREDPASIAFNQGPLLASYTLYRAVRPAADLGLGVGWAAYFFDRAFHLDFSADYEFKMFWSQNMMRKLLDDTLTGTSPSASDLFLHGLTLKARFDF